MATNQKDVELIIRAKDLSKSTLKEVASGVDKVTDALDHQVDAAKRGDVSLADLRESMKKLESAGQALIKQQALIDLYRKIGEQLEVAKQKSIDAAAAVEKHSAVMAAAETVTKRQEATLNSLTKASAGAEAKVNTLSTSLATQGDRLKAVGIDTKALDSAQNALVNTAQKTGVALGVVTTAVNNYNTELTKTRSVEKAVSDEAVFQKKLADASRLIKASDYVGMWTDALAKKDAAEAKTAQDNKLAQQAQEELNAFRQLADQANATAKGYATLGTASVRLARANSQLGPSVQGIIDPSNQARTSLGGLEAQVNAMAQSVAAIRGPFSDYTASLRELQAAQKAAAGQASLIDDYNNQMAAVRAARAAFVEARADVLQYATAIRNAKAPNEELAASSRKAQTALGAASRELNSQVNAARSAKAALSEAGISTSKLASEEQRLTQTAQTATAALKQLNTAHEQFNGEAGKTPSLLSKLNGGHRESLGLYQRVRGELIGLATAYIGIQGAIGLASGAIQAFIAKQTVMSRLSISVGTDPAKLSAEWDYIHGQSMRLGIGINELAESYSRFTISAKAANLTNEQTKYSFERISEAMRVMGKDGTAVKGAFYQLQQMLNKNKVTMEDLHQAADWIDGIDSLMAKGLGMVNVQQLYAALKDGGVDAKVAIMSMAEEMNKQFGDKLPAALKTLQAEQGRYNTSLADFKRLIAEAGFADAYTTLLKKLTAFFASSDGTKFAQDISKAFEAVVNTLSYLIDHLHQVELAMGLAFGYLAIASIVRTGFAIAATVKGVQELTAAYNASKVAALALAAAQATSAATGVAGGVAGAAEGAAASRWAGFGAGLAATSGWIVRIGAGLAAAAAAAAAFVASLPVSVVVGGLVAIAAAVGVIFFKFDELSAIAATVWHDLPYNAEIAWTAIKLGASVMADKVAPLFTWIGQQAASAWQMVAETASASWTAVVGYVQGAWASIVEILSSLVGAVATSMEGAGIPVRQLWADMRAGFEGLYRGIIGFFDRLTVAAINLGKTIKLKILEALSGAQDWIFGEGASDRTLALRAEISRIGQERDAPPSSGGPAGTGETAEVNAVAQHLALLDQLKAKEAEVNAVVARRETILDDIRAKRLAGTIDQASAEAQAKKTIEDFRQPITDATKGAAAFANTIRTGLKQEEFSEFLNRLEGPLARYNTPNMSPKDKKDKKAGQRESMEASLNSQLTNLGIGLDKKDDDNLEVRLENVGKKYDLLRDKVEKFRKIGGTSIDGVGLADVEANLKALEVQERAQVSKEFYHKKEVTARTAITSQTTALAAKEATVNDAVKERAEVIKTINDQVADGTITAVEGYAQIQAANDRLSPKIRALTQEAIKFAEALRGSGVPETKIDAMIAKMQRINQTSGGTPSANDAAGAGGMALVEAGQKRLNDVIRERNELVASYAQLVKLGAMTQAEATEKTEAAYARTDPIIQKMVADLKSLLDAMQAAGTITPEKFDMLNAKLLEISASAKKVDAEMVKVKEAFTGSFTSGFTSAFQSIAEGIAGAVKGTQSWGDAFKNVGVAAASFVAKLLMDVGTAIIQIIAMKMALAAIGMMSGGGASAAGGLSGTGASAGVSLSAGVAHSGGVIGSSNNVSRPVAASWFANAPRYHTGTNGPLGIKPDEQATILQKGEEVLSKEDPRNIMNSGKSKGGSPVALQQTLILDPNDIHTVAASPQGQQVMMTFIKSNATTLKQILKS